MKRPWIAAVLLGVAAVSVLGAQVFAPEEQRDLAAELAELNLTLLEIKDVLSQQLETDSLDLLLKRSELVSADVARLETRLRSAQDQRESLSDDEMRIEAQIETLTTQLRSGSLEMPADELDSYSRQMQTELERVQRRGRSLEGEIQQLQNRLTAKQRDLDSWHDLVDRRLGGV